jgi:protein TonB
MGEAAPDPPSTEDPSPTVQGARDLDALTALVLEQPDLSYPLRALRRGIEGVVRIGIEVSADGSVGEATVLRSSGSRELDRAARQNLLGWRFDPAAIASGGNRFTKDVRFQIL